MYFDYSDYYNYYNNYNPNMMPVVHGNLSYLRMFHACPKAPGVDIYVNNKKVATNLMYRSFTEYKLIVPGNYNIKVYKAGAHSTPLINKIVNIDHGSNSTIAVVGMLDDLDIVKVNDSEMGMLNYQAQVKFVHLVPNAPEVDVILPGGKILFSEIKYKQSSFNTIVMPANYTIQVRLSSSKQVVLTVPNVLLKPNKYYTIYAIGLSNSSPGLQAIIALDKASY